MLLMVLAALAIPLGLDLFMPVPESNPTTPEKIELGRRLFNDRRLSRDGTIACASCHERERAFSHGRALPSGVAGRVGRRHAPALVNRGYGRAFFWDARSTSLEEQVLKPIVDPNEMDMPVADAAKRAGVTERELSDALATYVRSLLAGDSPFDRFVNGDGGALTAQQQAGLQIFRGKGHCTACHVGPTLSDERTHNTGVAWAVADNRFLDEGRAAVSGKPEDRGAFKTPTLREVAQTAPYMHDGSLPTLEAVVDFYDQGGRPNGTLDPELRPIHLTVDEKRALVEFLRSLSGAITEGGKPINR